MCVNNKSWNAFVFTKDSRTSLDDLRAQGKVQESSEGYLYELGEDDAIILETALRFVVNQLQPIKRLLERLHQTLIIHS